MMVRSFDALVERVSVWDNCGMDEGAWRLLQDIVYSGCEQEPSAEEGAYVLAALSDLPKRHESAVRLYYGLQGEARHTHRKIAEQFGVSTEGARNWVVEGLRGLRVHWSTGYRDGWNLQALKDRIDPARGWDIHSLRLSARTTASLKRAGFYRRQAIALFLQEQGMAALRERVRNFGPQAERELLAAMRDSEGAIADPPVSQPPPQ